MAVKQKWLIFNIILLSYSVTITGLALKLELSSSTPVAGQMNTMECAITEGKTNAIQYFNGNNAAKTLQFSVSGKKCIDGSTGMKCTSLCFCNNTYYAWNLKISADMHDTKWKCRSFFQPTSSNIINLSVSVLVPSATITTAVSKGQITVDEGTLINLVCKTGASRPQATVTWNIGGKAITTNITADIQSLPNDLTITTSTLYFYPERGNHGNYIICTAYNIDPNITVSNQNPTIFDVRFGPDIVSLSKSSPQELLLNTIIPSIICNTTCNPACNYTWTKEGQGQISTTKELLLGNARLNHQGLYYCTACNKYGSKNSSLIDIDVQFGPYNVSLYQSSPQSIQLNTTIPNITCNASCKPSCIFTWTKVGQGQISATNRMSLGNAELDDNGSYYCTASNRHGTENSTIIVIDVQFSPETVSLSQPSPQEILLNTSIPSIICNATCNPGCDYTWTKVGRGQISTTTQLSLGSAELVDHGSYYCTASNRYGSENSTLIDIDVQYKPNKPTLLQKSPQIVYEGNSIPVINCLAECNPTCTFSWTKMGNLSVYYVIGDLKIGTASRNNDGIYVCIASNTFGTERSDDMVIDVKYGPGTTVSLTPANTQYTVIENNTINAVRCSADCDPPCRFLWNFTSTSNPLIFGPITKYMAGNYTCTATNDVSNSTVGIAITVHYPPRITDLQIEGGVMKNEGESIVLTCSVDSNPKSRIVWKYKQNSSILMEESGRKSSSLKFTKASCLDTGTYICDAYNRIIHGDSREINITVKCKPRLDHRIPQSEDTKIGLKKGETLNISVTFIAYPVSEIEWTFIGLAGETTISLNNVYNDSSISTSKNKSTAHSRLVRKSLKWEDFGYYTAVMNNGLGQVTVMFEVLSRNFDLMIAEKNYSCMNAEKVILHCKPEFKLQTVRFLPWEHRIGTTLIRTLNGESSADEYTLEIGFCGYQDGGTYTCKAEFEYRVTNKTISSVVSTQVKIIAPPVLSTYKIKHFETNNEIEVSAKFYSFPRPKPVEWYKSDQQIFLSEKYQQSIELSDDVSLSFHRQLVSTDGYKAVLLIKQVEPSDYTIYKLKIGNIIGYAEINIDVKEQFKSDIGIIIGSTTASVVVAILLAIGIVIVCKKRNHSKAKNEDGSSKEDEEKSTKVDDEKRYGSLQSSSNRFTNTYEELQIYETLKT